MEIKYQSLRGLSTVLERVKKECRLPVVKALHLKRLIREVAEEVALYNEQYMEIIDKHAKKDENGEKIVDRNTGKESIGLIDPQAFTKDMKELMEQVFEIDDRYADLTVDDLANIQVTAEEVEFLECILPSEEELVTEEEPVEVPHNKVHAFPQVQPPTEVVK